MAQQNSVTSMPADAQVAWIAARQHGVVSTAQLAAAGVDRWGVHRRVAAGWLHRWHRGVFAVGHTGLTRQGRWMAAVLAGGDGAVLSHRSAGALWGLCRDAPRSEITVPGRKRKTAHAGRIRPGETMTVDGIPVTKVARTLLDLAEVLSHDQLVQAIDNATNARLLHPSLMSSMMEGATGRRGLKPLRQALLVTRPQDVLTRSELERRALRLIRQARLRQPEVNVRLHGRERDLLWRDARLVVELDGGEYHVRERDTRRDTELLARGYATIRFTWRQVVSDPDWVVANLRLVLSA
jgi:very-short-patch-repair endonuclease